MAGITELGIVFQVAKGLFRLSQLYKNYGTRFSSAYDVYYAACGLKRWGVALYPQNYILGMVFANYTVTVSSLQLQAQNHLRVPITFIKGTVTSTITNEVLPALIDSYPIEQINPVPPKCKFSVRCLFWQGRYPSEQIPLDVFRESFGDFTLRLETNHVTIVRRFSREEIDATISRFVRESTHSVIPSVTTKNA